MCLTKLKNNQVYDIFISILSTELKEMMRGVYYIVIIYVDILKRKITGVNICEKRLNNLSFTRKLMICLLIYPEEICVCLNIHIRKLMRKSRIYNQDNRQKRSTKLIFSLFVMFHMVFTPFQISSLKPLSCKQGSKCKWHPTNLPQECQADRGYNVSH